MERVFVLVGAFDREGDTVLDVFKKEVDAEKEKSRLIETKNRYDFYEVLPMEVK